MPRRAKAAVTRSCAECGGTFETRREGARFCSDVHKVAFGNRMMARGKVVMPYVMGWLEGRGGGNTPAHPVAGKCMRELTSIVRDFLDEDREAGRPASTSYAESLFSDGTLYMDRKRSVAVRGRISASQAARLAPLKA